MQSFEPNLDKPAYQWLRLENDWVQENYAWSDISPVEAWGVFSHGVLLMVVSNQTEEVEDEAVNISSVNEMKWHVFLMYHQPLEGTNGVELMESFESLEAAKNYVDESKEDAIQVILEYINDEAL